MEKETYFSFKRYYGMQEKGEYTLHLPVRIGSDTLSDELEILLGVVGQGSFISYKQVFHAQMMIWMVTEKLEAYYCVCPEEARAAGEKMISVLETVDTDDDTFPAYDIARIRGIIGTQSI